MMTALRLLHLPRIVPMACSFRFNPPGSINDHPGLAAAMADAAGYNLSLIRIAHHPDGGITIASAEEDDFYDLETYCVERGIPFERITAEPSQMGREPHRVTFLAGMTEPALVLL